MLQEKYEEMLSKVEAEKYDIQKKNKGIEDALSYEIEFFKKEIARLSQKKEAVAATPIRNDFIEITPISKKMDRIPEGPVDSFDRESEYDKMDQIVAKAQASIKKVMTSPFGRAGLGMHTGANDSLDLMKNDFM